MLGRIARQIPRLVFVSLLTVIALLLYIGFSPDGVTFAHLTAPKGLVTMVVLSLLFWGVLIAFIAVTVPGVLKTAESIALGLVFFSLISVTFPELRLPVWAWVLSCCALVLVCDVLIYGPQWRPFRRDYGPVRLRFMSDRPLEVVWARLFPHSDHISSHIYGGAEIMPHSSGEKGAFLLSIPWSGSNSGKLTTVIHISNVEPFRHFVIRSEIFSGLDGTLGNIVPGESLDTMAVWLTPMSNGTLVEIDLTVHGVHLGTKLGLILQCFRRDVASSYKSRIQGEHDYSLSGRFALPALSLR